MQKKKNETVVKTVNYLPFSLQGWVPQMDREADREMHKKQCLMFSYGTTHISTTIQFCATQFGRLDFWQVLVETSVTLKSK